MQSNAHHACPTSSLGTRTDAAREDAAAIWMTVTGLPMPPRGKLTLLVGAEPADLERARPVSRRSPPRSGISAPVGSGTVYKLINNLMGAVQIAGLAEGIAIAEQAGLDMDLRARGDRTGVVASPQVLRHSKADDCARISPAALPLPPRSGTRMRPTRWRWPRRCSGEAPRRPRDGGGLRSGEGACAPTTDEGKMIEIVSRAKIGTSRKPGRRGAALSGAAGFGTAGQELSDPNRQGIQLKWYPLNYRSTDRSTGRRERPVGSLLE